MDWTSTRREQRPRVLTPCIGICTLGDDGLCAGCLRTTAEIAAWSTLTDPAKLQLMDEVLPSRERDRARR